jgi:hypothetical protein
MDDVSYSSYIFYKLNQLFTLVAIVYVCVYVYMM